MAMKTSEWIDFFLGANLPASIAANYAVIFHENRIRKDMLMDLNKEYLKEMGITVMGDVIAILKHARKFHEKDRTSGLVGESGDKILASRIVDSSKCSRVSLEEKQKPTDTSKSATKRMLKQCNDGDTGSQKTPVMSLTHRKQSQVGVPVKRVIGLQTPEAGNAVDHKRICLEKDDQVSIKLGKKTSVFDRLGPGETTVSSTTSDNPEPLVLVRGFGTEFVRTSTPADVKHSFGCIPSTRTSNQIEEKESNACPLPYQGILKRAAQLSLPGKSMKRDSAVSSRPLTISSASHQPSRKGGTLASDTETMAVPVKSRLGVCGRSLSSQQQSKTGVLRKNLNPKSGSVILNASPGPQGRTVISNSNLKTVSFKRQPISFENKDSIFDRLGR